MILFFPFDLLSHNLRCLQLAQAISSDFEVRIAGSGKYDHFFATAGIKTFNCAGISPEPVMEASRNFDFSWIKKEMLEGSFTAQVEAIRKYKPVAVVGDASFTLRMAASYTGTPFISVINSYMSRHYGRTRRLPLSHPAMRFKNKLPEHVFETIIRISETVAFWYVHRPFRQLARQYNFPKKSMFLQELEGDLTLMADIPELFPQKLIPNSCHSIGPLFHNSVSAEPELEDFMSNGRKNILVAMGSTGDPGKTEFLQNEKYHDYNIIYASENKKGYAGKEQNNIFYKPFINVSSIINKIDLMICHGGNGTIYQALEGGVPVLCAPSTFEQEWNLQGLEDLGLGERLVEGDDALDQIRKWTAAKDTMRKLPVSVDESKMKFREVLLDFFKEKRKSPELMN